MKLNIGLENINNFLEGDYMKRGKKIIQLLLLLKSVKSDFVDNKNERADIIIDQAPLFDLQKEYEHNHVNYDDNNDGDDEDEIKKDNDHNDEKQVLREYEEKANNGSSIHHKITKHNHNDNAQNTKKWNLNLVDERKKDDCDLNNITIDKKEYVV